MKKQRPAWASNRDLARMPRRSLGWCKCDRALVNDGQRCPVCKRKSGKVFKTTSSKNHLHGFEPP